MISRFVPLAFISARHRLNWSEILLGLEEGWLNASDVLASIPSLGLPGANEAKGGASSSPNDFVALVKKLSVSESIATDEVRLSWLRILMAWIFENREQIVDPLSLVDQLYADFNYPDEIYDLIRFNVPRDGYRSQDHTPEENATRLVRLWRDYCAEHMSPKA